MFDLSTITEVRDAPTTSSGMSDHELCPRKFLFRTRAGLVTKGPDPSGIRRGDIFHQIIAHALRGKEEAFAEGLANANTAKEIEETLATVSPAGYLENGQTPAEFVKTIASDTKVAIAMSRAYRKFFSVGPGEIAGLEVVDGLIESEVSTVGIGSYLDIRAAGTVDVIARDPKTDEHWVLDHKTCGWDIVKYIRTLPLSSQALLYPLLAKLIVSYLAQPKLAGICFCVIKTPTIRCCGTDGNDIDRFATRLIKWYEDNANTVMARTFIRPGQEITKFSGKRLDTAAAACVSLPVVENFPATGGSACQAYNSLCPFIGLCTRDTAAWPRELERFDRDWRYEEKKKDG